MEECQFCKSKLTTKTNLTFHQKNNKKCLDIQKYKSIEVKSELKECDFCNKKLLIIQNDIDKCLEEQDKLENEGISDSDMYEICNEKLTDGVNDIKNMKKDHTKFSKKLSKLLV